MFSTRYPDIALVLLLKGHGKDLVEQRTLYMLHRGRTHNIMKPRVRAYRISDI